jgi:3D (Asp-Asp-Asp) domain-containing protein
MQTEVFRARARGISGQSIVFLLCSLVFTSLSLAGVFTGKSARTLPTNIDSTHDQDQSVLGAASTKLTYESSFTQEQVEEVEPIKYTTVSKEDFNAEYGEETVVQQGVTGNKILVYNVTKWRGEEITRDLLEIKREEPTQEIISVGRKVVWRELTTEYGKLKYWRKLRVWATKYDGNCVGCRGLTYSGTLVRKGVCAVDPKVISLGTNFYVEGYGMCRSEDIGGAIKGNKVDLGFEDASTGNWGAAYTTVYLLTSFPE